MGATSNPNAARLAALQERKKSIEDTLAERNKELKQLCIQVLEPLRAPQPLIATLAGSGADGHHAPGDPAGARRVAALFPETRRHRVPAAAEPDQRPRQQGRVDRRTGAGEADTGQHGRGRSRTRQRAQHQQGKDFWGTTGA